MAMHELFLWLVGAHFLADWALQSDWMAKEKGRRWMVLAAHCAIYTVVCCIPIRIAGAMVWWVPPAIFGSHWLDAAKSRYITRLMLANEWCQDKGWAAVAVDQLYHIVVLAAVAAATQ